MSHIISQNENPVKRGSLSIVTTVVKLTGATYALSIPNCTASANSVVQLRRPGDAAVTVTQDDINSVTITGGVSGNEVMLVSLSDDPAVSSTVLVN